MPALSYGTGEIAMDLEERLKETAGSVGPLNQAAMEQADQYQQKLAKPPGSLGKLEDIAVRLSGITGKLRNEIQKRRIIVLCADNGVLAEGVACAPASVTAAQAVNMTKGLTGMSSLARGFDCEVVVADMGIACDYDCPEIRNFSLGKGTRNLAVEPAMTREQALTAINTGIQLAEEAFRDHVDIIGVGEMGIGNTTTSSAVLAALTGSAAEEVTGRGGGLSDEGFARKKAVIREALKTRKPDPEDPVDVLSKVGGFDLAAMCGVYIGAARYRIPVVIDGFISVVAALCAARICPEAKSYMFPSHASFEKGYAIAAEELGLSPWFLLDMRLGEGSGCPLAFEIVRAACVITNGMATFDGASINDTYLDEIREKDEWQ